MLTTGLFTTHRVEIACQENKPFKLIPFGDVHRDSDMHADEHWKDFLAYAKKQKDAVFLGMGDFTDGVSTSERIILSDHGMHDTTKKTLEGHYKGVVKTLSNELSFMRGRLIGLLGGNHYMDLGDGTTTDHVLAAQLGTKFLGVCSFIRLFLQFKHCRSMSMDIFCHHGKGGGVTPGGQFNTIEKMMNAADADIYLMGHTHGKGCIPSFPRLRLMNVVGSSNLFIRERTPWLGRTGSFLKAYESGRVSYNVDAGRAPCALGWIEFEITPKRVRTGGQDNMELQIRGTA